MTWKFLTDPEREKIARKTPYVVEGLALHEQAVRELNPRDDWKSLTDDERQAVRDAMPMPFYVKNLYAAMEVKLKEKNTPAKDKYTAYGFMGGDKFVYEDSLKRNIT